MKITFADDAKTDIIAFIVDEGRKLPQSASKLDEASGGLLTEAVTAARFEGKSGQQAIVVLPKGLDAKRAVLVGGGKPKDRDGQGYEKIGATVMKSQASSGFKSLGIHVDRELRWLRMIDIDESKFYLYAWSSHSKCTI